MKSLMMAFMTFMLVFTSIEAFSSVEDDQLNVIQNAINNTVNNIKSGKGYIAVHNRWIDVSSGTSQEEAIVYDVIFSGDLYKINVTSLLMNNGMFPAETQQLIKPGEITKVVISATDTDATVYFPDQKFARISARRDATEFKLFQLFACLPSMGFSALNYPILPELELKAEKYTTELKSEIIRENGSTLIRLDYYLTMSDLNSKTSTWYDADKGYTPVRAICYVKRPNETDYKITEEYHYTIRQYKDGIWGPKSVKVVSYHGYKGVMKVSRITETTYADDFELNVAVQPNDLVFTLPSGTVTTNSLLHEDSKIK